MNFEGKDREECPRVMASGPMPRILDPPDQRRLWHVAGPSAFRVEPARSVAEHRDDLLVRQLRAASLTVLGPGAAGSLTRRFTGTYG